MIIDANGHIYPKKFVKAVVERALVAGSSPFYTVEPSLNREHFMEPEPRIKHLDSLKIDMQVLTFSAPGMELKPREEALKLSKIANDGMAEIAEKYPGRFVATGVLSLLDVGEDLDEFDRAVKDLGLKGMTILSNIAGKPLDSPELEPFYGRAVKHDVPIYIHPARSPYWSSIPWVKEHRLDSMFGWPFDTTLAMARLVFGGILEKYPTLKFVTHHLGGNVPYFVGRANRMSGLYNYPAPNSSKKQVLDYFKMFYNDTALYGWTPALQCGYEFFGPDKILFGSDYPFGPEEGRYYLREALRSVNELKIPPEDKEKILAGNARKILKI